MKLAIIGSRNFNDYSLAVAHIKHFIEQEKWKLTHIISGGAKGADQLGAQFALEHDLELITLHPDWKTFGKGAGVVRNTQIIQQADCVIAFWDGKSKGTKDSIAKAKASNKKTIIIRIAQ